MKLDTLSITLLFIANGLLELEIGRNYLAYPMFIIAIVMFVVRWVWLDD